MPPQGDVNKKGEATVGVNHIFVGWNALVFMESKAPNGLQAD